jgi:hypothetical protein
MEAFASADDGTLTIVKENSPSTFVVEQTLATPLRSKVCTLDAKTGHILTITAEYGPPPAPPTPAPGAAPATGGGGYRGPRAPMVPGSFSIVVIGK